MLSIFLQRTGLDMITEDIAKFLESEGLEYSKRTNKLVYKFAPRKVVDFDKLVNLYNSQYDVLRPREAMEAFVRVGKELSESAKTYDEFEYTYPTVSTTEQLVKNALEYHRIGFTTKGDSLQRLDTPDAVRLDDAVELILSYRDEYTHESNPKDPARKFFAVDMVKRSINTTIINLSMETKNRLRQSLMYNPEYSKCAYDWLLCIFTNFGVKEDIREICTLVFMQWMWQVKAYIYKGQKSGVNDPLFINIFGIDQGTGKSYFIKKLGSPLADYMDTDVKMKHATMDNEMMRFAENYITFFDELVMGSNSNEYVQTIAGFKKVLTSTEFNPRMLYTQKQLKMPRLFSGISATNTPMIDTIYDDTGMRRFFEIPVNTTSDNNTVIGIIHQLPAAEIWRGIDENLPAGYLPPGSENFLKMRAIQDSYKKGDLLDLVLTHADDTDIEHPIMLNSEEGARIEAFRAGNPELSDEIFEKQAKCKIVPIYTFRKIVMEWLDDNMGAGQSKFVKNSTGLFHQLTRKGYLTAEKSNSQKVFCYADNVQRVGFISGNK
jgi:hypothetical protein